MPSDKINSSNIYIKLIVLVVIVATIVFSIIYFLDKESPIAQEVDKIIDTEQEIVEPNYDVLATDYFIGIIKVISDDELIVITDESEENTYLRNRTFEVSVGDKTEMFMLQGTFFVKQNKESTEIGIIDNEDSFMDPLTISDLSIDDIVIVLSHEDLKEKSGFIARGIYRADL